VSHKYSDCKDESQTLNMNIVNNASCQHLRWMRLCLFFCYSAFHLTPAEAPNQPIGPFTDDHHRGIGPSSIVALLLFTVTHLHGLRGIQVSRELIFRRNQALYFKKESRTVESFSTHQEPGRPEPIHHNQKRRALWGRRRDWPGRRGPTARPPRVGGRAG